MLNTWEFACRVILGQRIQIWMSLLYIWNMWPPAWRYQTHYKVGPFLPVFGFGDVMTGVTYSRYVKVTSIFEFTAYSKLSTSDKLIM